MELGGKIKRIREGQGVTQRELAQEVGIAVSLLSRIENGERSATGDTLRKIREALGLGDAPLTKAEVAEFRETLLDWGVVIKHEQMDDARASYSKLAQCAKLSYEPDLEILFTLISANYYLTTEEFDKAEEALAAAESRQAEFSAEHAYRFHMSRGVLELGAERYGAAACAFEKAEAVEGDVPLSKEGLYFNMAGCYTYTDRPQKALAYIEKAQRINQKIFDVHLDNLLALNWNKLGRCGEALELLKNCLRREQMWNSPHARLSLLHHNIGCVYAAMEKYDEVLRAVLSRVF